MKLTPDRKSFFIFFLVLLCLSVAMTFLYSPICPGQDFYFHFRRLNCLMDALRNGDPFLIYLDSTAVSGYGYFTKISYSDFILIPFAAIGNVTSPLFAYQFMIFCMTLLCGLIMYWGVNRVLKNPLVAFVSAILYTFSFYRLFDLYMRSALGEALSFTFVPLVALGTYEIIAGNYKKWYLLSIGYALLILTHTLSPVLAFMVMIIFLLIYCRRLMKEPKRFYYLVLSGIVIILLAAYYIFPTIEQFMSYEFLYQRDKVIAQTQDSPLAFHWIVWGLFEGLVQPRQLMIPGIGVLLTIIVALRLFVYDKSATLKNMDILSLVGLFLIFTCTTFFPWGVFPFDKLGFIQLPWRFLEFVSLLFSVSGAYYFSLLLKTRKRIFIGVSTVVILTVLMMGNDSDLFKSVKGKHDLYEVADSGNSYHLSGVGFVSAKVPSIEYVTQRGDSIKTLNSETKISNFHRKNGVTSFSVEAINKDTIELPLFYYKGYEVMSDGGKDVSIEESENGLVQVSVSGTTNIEVFYAGTMTQRVSLIITLLSFIVLIAYIVLQKRKPNDDIK